MNIFVSVSHSLESINGWAQKQYDFTLANMFIAEDNISRHSSGPSDQTGSHDNLS